MSGCACVFIDVDQDCCYTTLNQKVVTAKKKHKCGECHRDIEPGERYEFYSGRIEGEFGVEKTCIDCLSVRDSAIFCNGFAFQQVWDDICELIGEGEINWSAIAEFTGPAKEKIFAIIENSYWWDDED